MKPLTTVRNRVGDRVGDRVGEGEQQMSDNIEYPRVGLIVRIKLMDWPNWVVKMRVFKGDEKSFVACSAETHVPFPGRCNGTHCKRQVGDWGNWWWWDGPLPMEESGMAKRGVPYWLTPVLLLLAMAITSCTPAFNGRVNETVWRSKQPSSRAEWTVLHAEMTRGWPAASGTASGSEHETTN
jgi:hypothetical protein